MSETPRVDATQYQWTRTLDLARTLERELAAVTRERDASDALLYDMCNVLSSGCEDEKARSHMEWAEYILAERDALRAEVERLTICLNRANFQAEEFERKWYLRGDEVERLRSALLTLADAADDVGVRHFDGDTLPASVERMQTATATARAALQEPTP